jgi:hypothetical protein
MILFLTSLSHSNTPLPYSLSETVIIDFGGMLARFETRALAYRDLSPTGNFEEACHAVFDVLRWTETVQGANAVLLPDVPKELDGALDDRLFRAASGKRVGVII